MPFNENNITGHRVTFNTLSDKEIDQLLSKPSIDVLQCSEPIENSTWQLLNEKFFSQRPEVELRVYGFYNTNCDLSFTRLMKNVEHFSADCLTKASNIESISQMPNLRSLSLGVFKNDSFKFLNDVTTNIEKLFLGQTQSKKPDLNPLSRFKNLKKIYLEGQQKNIEVISSLSNLEDITLRSITTPDLSYLKPLRKFWSLDLKLGGTNNLSAIEDMKNIKYLELWQIRGLNNINVISSLTGLQNLYMESLPNIKALPSLKLLTKLRRILLDNMKGLVDISSLSEAPTLEELTHVPPINMQPKDYELLLRKGKLTDILVNFGNKEKRHEFTELLKQYNVTPRTQPSGEFIYY